MDDSGNSNNTAVIMTLMTLMTVIRRMITLTITGVAAIVIHLQNVVETWESRLIAALNGTMPIQDSDWSAFYQSLDEWIASLDQAQLYVGTTQAEEDRQEGKQHSR